MKIQLKVPRNPRYYATYLLSFSIIETIALEAIVDATIARLITQPIVNGRELYQPVKHLPSRNNRTNPPPSWPARCVSARQKVKPKWYDVSRVPFSKCPRIVNHRHRTHLNTTDLNIKVGAGSPYINREALSLPNAFWTQISVCAPDADSSA